MDLPPPGLARVVDAFPHFAPVQIKPVAVVKLGRDRFSVELAEQDVSEGLDDGRGSAFEQIRDAHFDRAVLDPDVAIGIGKPLVRDFDGRERRSRL